MKKALLICLLWAASGLADERILTFHSDILVLQDGWIEVTERITVRAENKRIQRGIYRDIPTQYTDSLGNDHVVVIEALSVRRNNQPEAFHGGDYFNGVRFYFGRAEHFIEVGEHTYEFRYRASRMLGFFEQHDELYWNVTGLDWAFPIDRASATVSFAFEPQASEVFVEAYTGAAGSTARDYSARIDEMQQVTFVTTKKMPAHHGLTIVVGWPKGYVDEPGEMQRLGWLLKDNANLLAALSGLLLLLLYYIPVWMHFGKDPEPGVLVTRYEPPAGFSPASLRYIRQMYYDDKTMTAAVVNLAVKGYLRINASVKRSGFFNFGGKENEHSLSKLTPPENAPALAPGERELYDELFREGNTVVLEQENHERLGEARSAHEKSLRLDYRNKYFQRNGLLNIPAILIAMTATFVSLSVASRPTFLVILAVIAMLVVVVVFAIIMKRPTMRGRKLLDEMAGFRDYLEVAERDELNLRNPPEKTPALFEAYLPYALALGVDQQWAEKFAAVLSATRDAGGAAYKPAWYSGNWNVANLASSTSQISSSLNTAISSSVTPPGSSSGGGGGGSSGGGGGGGGGGGW
ncbi:MAG: DUF2207 domain-containing protein [Gammaproteobacteria bacterium]|nr:DUF2207 domain-containing protein [Gammaproteobacteria bacterium]MDH5304948.1 DUF2207 domain-containing protein [Gammaproteobacteria bacterium]MDH5321728.1 DUF2207 domain-containing protein [Gammaproteobacteria bacterium]